MIEQTYKTFNILFLSGSPGSGTLALSGDDTELADDMLIALGSDNS
jgi:hypothetical protein